MPPKKAATATGDDNGGKFSWTPENEKKLLLFMIGTTTFAKDDLEHLAEHAFIGTSASAVQQRANKFRREHRALYEAHGLRCPDGKAAPAGAGAGASAGGATPQKDKKGTPKGKKRAASSSDNNDYDNDNTLTTTPAKKARKTNRKTKVKTEAETAEDTEEDAPPNNEFSLSLYNGDDNHLVKAEEVDEEFDV